MGIEARIPGCLEIPFGTVAVAGDVVCQWAGLVNNWVKLLLPVNASAADC